MNDGVKKIDNDERDHHEQQVRSHGAMS